MDDEIDLRAYFSVLWRGRWVVAVTVLGVSLVTGLVSKFVLPRVYEASAMVVVRSAESPSLPTMLSMVDGSTIDDTTSSAAIAQLVASVSQPASLSADSYRELASSPEFRDQLGRRLREDPSPGAGGVEAAAVSDSWTIRPEVVRNSNLLKLNVEAATPPLAASVANAAARELMERAERLNRERLERTLRFLEGQLSDARTRIDQAMSELQAFSRQSPSVAELKGELDEKLELLTRYKADMIELGVTEERESARLSAMEEALDRQQPVVTIKKGLNPDAAALRELYRPDGAETSIEAPALTVEDQQLNPVYLELATRVAEVRAGLSGLRAERARVEKQIEALSGDLERLRSTLVERQARQDDLDFQAQVARRRYETLLTHFETQETAVAARIEATSLTLAASAVPPRSPSRPRVALNVAVSAFLGLMVAVFGLFFAEFLRRPAGSEPDAARREAGALATR